MKGGREWLPEKSYQEQLEWYPSGKLLSHTVQESKQDFSYNERGYLKSTGSESSEISENYEFDLGSLGTGVLTAAPGWHVSQEGLDEFSKILSATFRKNTLSTEYNSTGEVITHGQKHLSWDPWGRLIKITDPGCLWEASYDALGRRLQTRYTKAGEPTRVINSLYDPNEEFQEIGMQVNGKTFWKIYGPDGCCDAISDETGAPVNLAHNALRQLTAVVSCQGICYSDKLPSAYGPIEAPSSVSSTSIDLVTYAQSLSWHSKSQDSTGFIWMGDRYYDPRAGRFLSQDSVSYPSCLDLYTYANGDPINYFDPDGRFASPVYEPIKSTVLSVWNNPRVHGSLQAFGGIAEASAGVALSSTPLAPLGLAIMAHGADHVAAGGYTMMTGRPRATATEMLLQKAGMSPEQASLSNNLFSLGSVAAAPAFARHCAYQINGAVSQSAMHSFSLSKKTMTPRQVKFYLSNAQSLSKDQIISDLESIGLVFGGKSLDRRFWSFNDKYGNVRVKIHPPDRTTSYDHIHIYDKSGNPLNKHLKIVDRTSPEAHIPYGGNQ